MKKIYIKAIAIMITVFSVSCSEEFLELTPYQSVADTEAIQNLDDYKSSITGVYNVLTSSNYYGRYFMLIPDVMADDVKQNAQANRVRDYAEYIAQVDDAQARDIFTLLYSGINACNNIINADVTVPAGVKDQQDHMIGEAYALRGLMHFDLVRLYAQHYTFTPGGSHLGVPIVLSFDPTALPNRNTVNEVYDQVIADMTKAISMMQSTPYPSASSKVTLSSTAVKAFLSRVYLYKEDWVNAEAMATDVIASGSYSLVANADYDNIWLTKNSSESILELYADPSDNNGSDALGGMYLKTGYGDYLPSNDVVSLFPAGDARLSRFVVDAALTAEFAPFRMEKYSSVIGDDNMKVMRIAEVYLIRAEARAEQGGAKETGAQADVTLVRQRGLPAAPPVTATGQALKDEIALERRVELCFEGHRLWDLTRKKQDVIRTQCTADICTITYPNDRFVLPIPQAEIFVNSNIEQNPGYGN